MDGRAIYSWLEHNTILLHLRNWKIDQQEEFTFQLHDVSQIILISDILKHENMHDTLTVSSYSLLFCFFYASFLHIEPLRETVWPF